MTARQFATIRLIVVSIVVFAQVYLFVRIRQAIKSSHLPYRFKTFATVVVAVAIVLLFAANRYIMLNPIARVDPPLTERIVLFYLPAVWGVGSILAALVLCLAQCLTGLGRMAIRIFRSPAERSASAPINPERRRFLQAGVGAIAAAPFMLSGYGAVLAGRNFKVREVTFPFGRSLRVVQITDIHCGIYMTTKELRRLADQVIALEPDLFVLTGDYISNSMVFLPGCVEEMSRVRARYGTFATLGNHEHWYGEVGKIKAVFSQYDIPLLVNTNRLIRSEHGDFAVAGIDDLRSGVPDLDAALSGLDSTTPTILLSHRPEIFPLAAEHSVALTLAGHYHGGQIKLGLPGEGISLADLITPYPEGPYRIAASRLYVSRGIGTTFTPVRLNVPPEITLLNLTV
jgi:predicted MPP superfamily phosphohydrolase